MINKEKHLAYTLKVRIEEIKWIIEHIDHYYYEFKRVKKDEWGIALLNPDGSTKSRIINPSKNRLKQIQKRINIEILSQLIIPDYAYGSIKGKDNGKHAKKHQGKKYFFSTDIKEFFPFISAAMVYEMFRDNNFSPTVSRILTQLTTYKGKLPQGAPTSPIIANLVFIKTGKRLDSFAKENRLTFTTYQDDIYFSSPVDFKILTGRIIELIRADGYLISHKKTYYKTKNPIVTGLIVKNNRLAVKNSFLLKLKDVANKRPEQIQGLKNYLYKIEKLNKSR